MNNKKMYFNPGCALSIYKPDMENKILAYLNENYDNVQLHKICCHHDPRLSAGSTIINVCAGCDRRFRTLYSDIDTISLWEVLDKLDNFPFPDYYGKVMSIHDPCPIRVKPQVHAAVRNLLYKMNIKIDESEYHGTHSICCGDSLYQHCPVEQVNAFMKKRAASMPCEQVAVYCVSCIKSMYIGGKKPCHIIDLLYCEDTDPQVYDTVEWHDILNEYIDTH